MKVLIIEDEMIISEDIAMMLEDQGYEVVGQAVSFQEAQQAFDKFYPDLVLVDINIQGIKDGVDFAHYINEKGKVPFIFTSSISDESTIARAKETRPSTYLVKPFQDEQLIAAIEVALGNFAADQDKNNQDNGESFPIFNDAIFIKDGSRFKKLLLDEIIYVQKSHNYLEIYTSNSRFLIRVSLGQFIDQIESDKLLRVHNSYAVNPSFITEILPNVVKLHDNEVPLSRSYSDELKRRLKIF